jgi:hypothetical protein
MILVDSSVWIDYFNGILTPQTDKLDELLGQEPLALGDLILAEVLQGFRLDKDYRIAKRLLTSLTVYQLFDREMAIKSAENYRLLRKKGVTIRKTAHAVIATFCLEQGIRLLHSDKDFEPFAAHLGLRTLTPGG